MFDVRTFPGRLATCRLVQTGMSGPDVPHIFARLAECPGMMRGGSRCGLWHGKGVSTTFRGVSDGLGKRANVSRRGTGCLLSSNPERGMNVSL